MAPTMRESCFYNIGNCDHAHDFTNIGVLIHKQYWLNYQAPILGSSCFYNIGNCGNADDATYIGIPIYSQYYVSYQAST